MDNPVDTSEPMRMPTDLELWAFIAGMSGWYKTDVVELWERVTAADEAEEAALA